ncbi:50S ribosomal protein L3 [Sedimentisphaera salicampi]|uniref:Large ribosomal subunit protein uL3 n=1 Tax=Sedimentisphaera salicampi TaxID=1941349 RepID=A0A1W6LPE2_9BACT|nr:50S ribosomal protein L3 [Sedimentisphaera salicampi]ARN57649.1 50S ribosomal protein L3 [Sedimentisphaera salicampi]OXU14214.1 50S ribosomal protein L3 [Sedimentisphaera salicampi]
MTMLLGKKVGMTRIYDDDGSIKPVTVIEAGPCIVTQVKTEQTDGYEAVQIGFDDIKPSRAKKPMVGHYKKAGAAPKKFVREMRLKGDSGSDFELGQQIKVDVFDGTKYVDVVGTSKGKGFAGGMKRHGFGGFPATHGTERKHRANGSLASFASDAGKGGNIKKGKKMSGHTGNVKVTTKNHELVSIDSDKNLLVVKGAVPGPSGGYVIVKTAKTAKNKQ